MLCVSTFRKANVRCIIAFIFNLREFYFHFIGNPNREITKGREISDFCSMGELATFYI